MNKLFTKIVGAALGLTMAIGVGVAIGNNSKVSEVKAGDTTLEFDLTKNPGSWPTTASSTLTNYTYTLNGTPYTFGLKNVNCNSGYLMLKSTAALGLPAIKDYKLTKVVAKNSGGCSTSTKVGISSSASSASYISGGAIQTWSTTSSTYTYNLSGTADNTVYYLYVTNKNAQITKLALTYEAVSSGKTETTTTIAAAGDKTTLDVTKTPADTVQLTATAKYGTTTITTDASNFTWGSSSTSVATVSSSGVVTAVGVGSTTITADYGGDATYDASTGEITINVVNPNAITYDTTAQGYSNEQVISSWSSSGNIVTVSFSNGKYYSSGTAVRAYGGSTITVSSETKTITSITFTFGSSDNSNTITANTGTFASPTWTGEASSVQFSIGGTSGHRRIKALNILLEEKVIVTPTKTTAEWKDGSMTVYNGEAKNVLSTLNVYAYEEDDDGNVAESHLSGTGFILKIYKNGTLTYTLDASSAAQSQSFTGLDPTSGSVAWTITATVGSLTESSALSLTVTAKEASTISWTSNYEQEGTFVSFAQKLHINGRISGSFNDGTSNFSQYNVTTNVYTGSSAVEANKIYSVSKTYQTHNNGFDITNSVLIEGKSMTLDEDDYLAYTSSTTFYVEMYLTDFPQQKIGKLVNVVIPTLYAEDGNSFNYYVGSTYSTCVKNVSLKYGGNIVKSLTPEDVTLSANTVTPTSTTPISIDVTYSATESFNLTTSYSITPKQPATLELIELYDNSGDPMTNGESLVMFKAGENFHLFNKSGQTYFAYVLDSEFNEIYISSYADLSFELLDSSSATSGSGSPITTSTYMRKNMDTKWIRATYSQGASSVSFTYQLDIENATIDDYSEGSLENYYQKVTSLDELSDSSDCIIAITISDTTYAFDGRDAQNGFTEVDVDANDRITYSTDMAKLACVVTEVTDGYAIQVSATSTSNAEKYISGTSGSNALSFTTDPVTLEIEATSGRTAVGGSWDIWSNGNKFSFNGNTNNYRYRFFKSSSYNTSGYYAVDFFKRAGSSGTGNKITYLKQVIDAFRLNADLDAGSEGLSICSADSGIYSSDYWKGTNNKISVKTLYQNLTAVELLEIQVQDKFGEVGKTYNDTFLMLLSKDPAVINQSSIGVFGLLSGGASSTVSVIVIVSLVSLTAIGGYFFLRKRKEN